MATQMGTTKKVASSTSKVTAPAMESFTFTNGSYTLKNAPTKAISEIYALNDDSTFGVKYMKETAASESAFAYDDSTHTITAPTSVSNGVEMFVMYEYETENAVEVVNSAKQFPVGCKFIMEVLGCDVCDQTNLIYAYVIFNNFKLSPDFDWSIATDGAHPFSGKAQQDYCDKDKKLFSIVIPGEDETATEAE